MPFNLAKRKKPNGLSRSKIQEELSLLRPSDLEGEPEEVSRALMRMAVHGTEPFRELPQNFDPYNTSPLVNPKWVTERFYSLPSSDNNTNDGNDKEKNLRGDWHAAHEDQEDGETLSPATDNDDEVFEVCVTWKDKSPSKGDIEKILTSKPKLKLMDSEDGGLHVEVRYEVAIELERELKSVFPDCKVEIRRTKWSLNA